MFVMTGCTDFKQDKDAFDNNDRTIKLDVEVIDADNGENAFNISLIDFIESFNSCYKKDNDEILLKGLEEWQLYDVVLDKDNGNVTTCYSFSEDVDIRALPQLKVCSDNTKSDIKQISVCYDIHSFSPETYEQYEEMCYYVLRTMITELSDDEVKEYTYKMLEALDESFTTDKTSHDAEQKYTLGPVSVYPYYVVGETMELRVVPAEDQ